MSYSAHTFPPSREFRKSVLTCLACSLICCSLVWSQTPLREVSGIGAQASAHGVDATGVLMDVQVIFNATAKINQNSASSVIAVLLTETYPGFEKRTFASLPSNDLNYWYSADAVLHLTATVTLVGNGSNDQSSSREALLALNWDTKTGAKTVSAHSSNNQSGHSITQDLSGTVQRTKVSGTVSIDGFSVSTVPDAASYWAATNNRWVDQIGSSNASSDIVVVNPDSAASACGWTGYWTWSWTPSPGEWTWIWIWNCPAGPVAD